VAGAIVLVVALVVFPVVVIMSGVIAAATIGETMRRDAETRHAGSELLDCNV